MCSATFYLLEASMGFDLSKREFRDALDLRYDLSPTNHQCVHAETTLIQTTQRYVRSGMCDDETQRISQHGSKTSENSL